jgi:alpha-D-xyloside xylohydrolase
MINKNSISNHARHNDRRATSSVCATGRVPAASLGQVFVFRTCWMFVLGLILLGAMPALATDFPGNPPITPRWAYEPWAWEDNGNTQSSTTNLINGYLSRDIPVGAVIVDSPWSTAYMSFAFNTSRYPDPAGMISDLRAQGVQVVCWMVGMINQSASDVPLSKHPLFDYARTNGLCLKEGTSTNDVFSYWKGTGLGVDFSNPTAVNWFMTNMSSSLISMGVRGFKVDVSNDYLSSTVKTTPGSVFGGATITRAQHTEYYYASVCDWIRSQTANEGIIIARPYSWQLYNDTQCPVSRLTAGWCGDFGGDFSGFMSQLGNIYTSALGGYSAVGFEVGGYYGANPTRDSLLRQTQYASLLPILENGGSNGGQTYHLPWYWDSNGYTDTVNIYRYYATLHHNLVPFQFHCGVHASLTGQPALSQVDASAYRHVLGNTFLTWAVTAAGTQPVAMTFPAGSVWIDWWHQTNTFVGGSQTNITYTMDKAPIFVRAGSIVPANVDNNTTGLGDANSAGKDTILFFPWKTNQMVYHRPLADGIDYEDVSITATEGDNGSVQISSPTSRSWIFKIKAFAAPTTVTGADSWNYDSANNVLTVSKTGSAFTIGISSLAGYSTIIPLNPPAGLNASAGNNQVSLSWSPAVGASSYNLKRATISGGPYTILGNVSVTNYVDSAVTNGTTYYYVVSAVYDSTESTNSSEVSATPQAAPPAITDTMNATDGGGTTSFNTGLHWTSGLAPGPGTNYFTAGYALRTPTAGSAITFQGNSLTINTNASALGKLQSKMPAGAVITITNLIMAGGMVNYANNSDNFTNTLAGAITISNIPGNVTNYFVMGGSTTAGTGGEMLDVTATISGSGKVQVGATSSSSTEYYMTVAGGTPAQWQGALKLSADNPYGGTMKVVGNPAHTVRGGLQLNHTNALKNATLVLATTTVNPLSFEAGVNASPFNIGALAGTISEALTDTAGSPVTLSVGANNSSTIYSGALTGSGSLVKTGTGTLTLAGTNTYSGTTVVKNGTLALSGSGSLASANISVATNATFDVSAVTGGSYTLNGSGTLTLNIAKSGGTLTQGRVTAGSLTAGGTLNVTASGDALAAGDTFTIISAASFNGTFATTNLPPLGSSLTWSNRLSTDGTLAVVSLVSTAPTNLLWSVSGTNLTLSWPADHTGWRLQVQTNSLSVGLGTNWMTVANSTNIHQITIPMNTTNNSVFYRLVYP